MICSRKPLGSLVSSIMCGSIYVLMSQVRSNKRADVSSQEGFYFSIVGNTRSYNARYFRVVIYCVY